ncbi:MAG: insulinase family protein [Clostridiales bacterium]|nr:insulinase family protein [Clostridiales bacterium]
MSEEKKMFKDQLPNGIRVVGECMPGFRSVSMGVFIGAGSVYEPGSSVGAAHFIEHMLFKGTKTRTASDIAEEMDAVGGNLNAFTSKECTCFYGRVLGKDVAVLAEILADLLENSLLDPDDIEREKGVVTEEILMNEDSPEDLVIDTAAAGYYEGDPLERPILGTVESVKAFTRDGLRAYMSSHYRPGNTVIAVAGSFDREELMSVLAKSFTAKDAPGGEKVGFGIHTPGKRIRFIEKDIEQAHIALCLPGFKKDTVESYAMLLFSNAFGGSMSSRLFQKIREENGLAYSVYSYPTPYPSSGCFTVYAGTGADNALTVTEMILDEMKKVSREGIGKDELSRAKDQLISSYLMSRESTSARASAIGRAELFGGRHYTEEEIIEKITRITMDNVFSIIPTVTNTLDMSACVVGRIKKSRRDIEKILSE